MHLYNSQEKIHQHYSVLSSLRRWLWIHAQCYTIGILKKDPKEYFLYVLHNIARFQGCWFSTDMAELYDVAFPTVTSVLKPMYDNNYEGIKSYNINHSMFAP